MKWNDVKDSLPKTDKGKNKVLMCIGVEEIMGWYYLIPEKFTTKGHKDITKLVTHYILITPPKEQTDE